MSRFDVCLAETLKWEGGWSNHKDDPGGPTMKGIILSVFAAARGVPVPPKGSPAYQALCNELRMISSAEVTAIYRRNYWDPLRCDDLPAGLDLVVFDFGVNSGISRSAKALQKVLGVTIDGHIGELTISTVADHDTAELCTALLNERRRFIRQIKHYPSFAKGWERRIDGVENCCLQMLGDWQDATSVAEPLANPDEQSASQARARPPVRPQDQLSGTEKGAGAAIIGSLALAAQSVSTATQAKTVTGGIVTMRDVALAAILDPLVWGAIGIVAGAFWALIERRSVRKTEGV